MSTTANTITDVLDNILVRGMRVLRERVMFSRLVNRDYSDDAKAYGSTVDIPYSTAKTSSSVTPAETPPAPGASTVSTVQISLDQWQHVDFHLSDKDIKNMNAGKVFVPIEVEEAFRAMARNINQYIAALYTGIYGWVGTAAVTPFGAGVEIQSATDARKVLNSQLCPRQNRKGVLDDTAEAAALNLAAFHNANKSSDRDVVIEGEIGRKFGIDWYADDDIQTHTAGTVGTDVTVNGAHTTAVNDRTDTISLTSTAGGTLVEGDIITIAGDSQTYAVTADVTLGAGTNHDVSISPGIQVATTGGEAVTKKAAHTVNLVFHPDCFGLAMRAPDQNLNQLMDMLGKPSRDSIGVPSRVAADPLTGLVCRIEIMRQYKQVVFDLDWLYGAKLVDARKGCRIAG